MILVSPKLSRKGKLFKNSVVLQLTWHLKLLSIKDTRDSSLISGHWASSYSPCYVEPCPSKHRI